MVTGSSDKEPRRRDLYDYVGDQIHTGKGWIARARSLGRWFHITEYGPAYDERYDYVEDFSEHGKGLYLALVLSRCDGHFYITTAGNRIRW